jgi:hypothetical protein
MEENHVIACNSEYVRLLLQEALEDASFDINTATSGITFHNWKFEMGLVIPYTQVNTANA